MKKIFTILGLMAITGANAQIVINKIYAGGGNKGATYSNDYVELINSGDQEVTLAGAYLQYSGATSTFNTAAPLKTITLQPKQTYIVKLGKGGNIGSDFMADEYAELTYNINPSSPTFEKEYKNSINMGGNGKLALTNKREQISSPTDEGVLDFVGWGSANAYEGTGAAPALTDNSKSISRTDGKDTNDNKVDFTRLDAALTLGSEEITISKIQLVKNTFVENALVFGVKSNVKIYNTNGQLVKSITVVEGQEVNVSALPKGIYIVTGEVNGKVASQKIIKK